MRWPWQQAFVNWIVPFCPLLKVDAAWDAAVASLKAVLEPAFSGASAAAAMLTVKDFLLLVCLALGERAWRHAAYQGLYPRERLAAQEDLAVVAAPHTCAYTCLW